jgi:hypothetical protein
MWGIGGGIFLADRHGLPEGDLPVRVHRQPPLKRLLMDYASAAKIFPKIKIQPK